jgi:hypothetical protein
VLFNGVTSHGAGCRTHLVHSKASLPATTDSEVVLSLFVKFH